MSAIIEETSPTVVLPASEANLCDAWAVFGCSLPDGFHDGADMQRIISGLPSAFWNSVYRARFAPNTVDEQIEATLAPYKERNLDMFWWLTSSSQPANLGERLEAHGLTRVGALVDMAADLRNLPGTVPTPSALVIEEVRTRKQLLAANRVLMAGFALPDEIALAMTERMTDVGYGDDRPWHLYLALLDGKPVATATLFLKYGVAGIYNVATVPEAQRQGIGAAVTLAAMHAGRARGYRVAVLHATDMGLPVYGRLGFEEKSQIGLYFWAAPRATD